MIDPNFDEIPAYIAKKGEEFMSAGQLKHFIHKLNVWRDQLVSEAESLKGQLTQENTSSVETFSKMSICKCLLSG